MTRHVIITLFSCFLLGCSRGSETGPVDIRWDREVCARCSMSIGDRLFAAEVRGGPSDRRSEVYKFDDLGCAVIWLDGQSWKGDPRVEMWVADHRNGTWLDAIEASYVSDVLTPMDYGLGAQDLASDETITFDDAAARIRQANRRPSTPKHADHEHHHHEDHP